jgi:hypothetical protein
MLSTLLPWAWDDFTSAATGTIRNVSWQGAYCVLKGGGRPPSAGPPRGVATTFQVGFDRDLNGRPLNFSPTLHQVRLTSAEVHEQFAFDSVRGDADCAYYGYTAVLSVPFPVTAGTRYWLLIRAGESGATWGWRVGQQDNGVSAAGSLNPGIRTQPRDLAFSLTSE